MKINILFIIVASFGIFSCSKSDDAVLQETSILPIKVIDIDRYGSSESLISYNGKKINEVNSIYYSNSNDIINSKTRYSYNEDLITKKEVFEINLLKASDDYTYENSKLTMLLHKDYGFNQMPGLITKKEYTHNQDGTILLENYDIDIFTGIETKTDISTIHTFENGNIIKKISNSSYYNYYNPNTPIYFRSTSNYEYDDKINPFKNVIGLDKININFASQNNITKISSFYETSSDNITYSPPSSIQVTNYNLLYESNNYLKESKYDEVRTSSIPATFTNITQYFY